MGTIKNPDRCVFCGYYLTIEEQYAGQRCIDPAHWQAAGRLAPRDFYAMALLVAGSGRELALRPVAQPVSPGLMGRS